ncbi:MAG: polymer-forming cytoskeletal protein [Halanaeroarchaeum sp.]
MASSRTRRGIVAVLALLLVASASSGAVAALSAPTATDALPAQTGPAGTVVVEEGSTSSGISTVAGTIVVRGTVNGDVSGVAGDVVIAESGTVTGNVNGAAGSLRIAGTVGGNVDFAAGSVVVDRSARIGGNVNIGTASTLFAGQIAGDATVGADQITVAPTATIDGDLRYDGQLERQEGATIGGAVVHDPSIGGGMGPAGWGTTWSVPGWFDTVYGFFANLVLGAVLLALFPRFSNEVADGVVDRPLRSGGWGVVALFGIPVVLVAFAITIIGIPIALLGIVLYVLAIWTGVVYGEFAVGRYLLARMDAEGKWKALFLGLLVFAVLGLVPILGGIAVLLALLIGLGALGSALRGRFRNRHPENGGPSATDAPADDSSDGPTPTGS